MGMLFQRRNTISKQIDDAWQCSSEHIFQSGRYCTGFLIGTRLIVGNLYICHSLEIMPLTLQFAALPLCMSLICRFLQID